MIDMDALLELRELMEEEFAELILTYVADSKVMLARMGAAIESSDTNVLREAAHSLKGSSANLFAVKLSDTCKILEDSARESVLEHAQDQLEVITFEFKSVVDKFEQLGWLEN